jgi:hypothetical protein|tara:strand:+ start:807 stop:1199 length:393 start_codon:yes stop_codon:yes gene_type:complete
MSRKVSRSKLIKKLDTVFSEWIRRRHAKNNIAICVTCGKKDHWKKLQCGHFQSRKHYSTRWDEINCQVQCSGCNVFRYGEQYKFSLWLDTNIKKGTSQKLYKQSKKTYKFDNYDLLELIEIYKNKISLLK